MKRTELNRGTSQLKRAPMKKRAKRHRDTPASLAVRAQYRLDNPKCELTSLLIRYGVIRGISDGGLECHHLAMGNSGRIDLVSNLIMLSREVHAFCHAEPSHGTILCLYAKMKKNPGEIDAEEFRRCTGQHLAGYASSHKPKHEWMIPMWQELVEECELIVE